MLNKQTTLYLYRGATSSINFDFSNFNFNGGKCVFTMSNICKNTKLYQYEFNESKLYTIVIPDEFTATSPRGELRHRRGAQQSCQSHERPRRDPQIYEPQRGNLLQTGL